ncbi:MAG TPA: Ig-like domain-containing protein [Actinomycetota bacterium]|nr:Ig-like domain-containing protein [Actinomycetota bacterium]
MNRKNNDVRIGRRPVRAALTFLLIGGAMLLAPAAHSLAPAVEPSLATPRIEFRSDPAEGGTIVTATVHPADATGTVRFKLDNNYVGSPVPLVDGTARSLPMAIPAQTSHQLSVEYSGDARYQPITVSTHYDWWPEDPAPAPFPAPNPAAPAQPPAVERPGTLVRTGSESMLLAVAAAALIGLGLVLTRLGGKPRPEA